MNAARQRSILHPVIAAKPLNDMGTANRSVKEELGALWQWCPNPAGNCCFGRYASADEILRPKRPMWSQRRMEIESSVEGALRYAACMSVGWSAPNTCVIFITPRLFFHSYSRRVYWVRMFVLKCVISSSACKRLLSHIHSLRPSRGYVDVQFPLSAESQDKTRLKNCFLY